MYISLNFSKRSKGLVGFFLIIKFIYKFNQLRLTIIVGRDSIQVICLNHIPIKRGNTPLAEVTLHHEFY
jgi:hypothetical protein